jgi:hypothetical protein
MDSNNNEEVEGFWPGIIWVVTKMPIFLCLLMLLITSFLLNNWYFSDRVLLRAFEFSQISEPIIYWLVISITGLIVLLMCISILYRVINWARGLC